MAYALDLLIAVLCVLTAIPLIMQLGPSTTYRRYLDEDGNPIDVEGQPGDGQEGDAAISIESDTVSEEIANFSKKDAPPPEGTGWQRDRSGKGFRHYLSCALGAAMLVGAVWLVFTPPWPSHYIAWAIFGGASIYGARGIPHLLSAIGQRSLNPANFIIVGVALLGVTEGLLLI